MMDDKEVFKRTKYASWSVRVNTALSESVYAYHNRCKHASSIRREAHGYSRLCSWFASDSLSDMGYGICHSCYMTVPDYIQSLVRLHEGI